MAVPASWNKNTKNTRNLARYRHLLHKYKKQIKQLQRMSKQKERPDETEYKAEIARLKHQVKLESVKVEFYKRMAHRLEQKVKNNGGQEKQLNDMDQTIELDEGYVAMED